MLLRYLLAPLLRKLAVTDEIVLIDELSPFVAEQHKASLLFFLDSTILLILLLWLFVAVEAEQEFAVTWGFEHWNNCKNENGFLFVHASCCCCCDSAHAATFLTQ